MRLEEILYSNLPATEKVRLSIDYAISGKYDVKGEIKYIIGNDVFGNPIKLIARPEGLNIRTDGVSNNILQNFGVKFHTDAYSLSQLLNSNYIIYTHIASGDIGIKIFTDDLSDAKSVTIYVSNTLKYEEGKGVYHSFLINSFINLLGVSEYSLPNGDIIDITNLEIPVYVRDYNSTIKLIKLNMRMSTAFSYNNIEAERIGLKGDLNNLDDILRYKQVNLLYTKRDDIPKVFAISREKLKDMVGYSLDINNLEDSNLYVVSNRYGIKVYEDNNYKVYFAFYIPAIVRHVYKVVEDNKEKIKVSLLRPMQPYIANREIDVISRDPLAFLRRPPTYETVSNK